jgi:two-component system, probable response regulator PhcQ
MSKSYTILLVDDEAPIRKALRRVLKYEPYTIIDAESPFQALELLKETPVHLVISDHTMPGMLGIDLLRKIHLFKPNIIRIILTGNADLDMAMKAINEGSIYRFLTKPWDNDELLVTVRMGLRQYALEEENRRLLALVKKHREFLLDLEERNPGMTGVKRTSDGKVVLDDLDVDAALEEFGGSLLESND